MWAMPGISKKFPAIIHKILDDPHSASWNLEPAEAKQIEMHNKKLQILIIRKIETHNVNARDDLARK